jgi:hypothetical protein
MEGYEGQNGCISRFSEERIEGQELPRGKEFLRKFKISLDINHGRHFCVTGVLCGAWYTSEIR